MIVGEAPGPNEDVAGRPFIGKSGELLQEGLDLIGLTDFYITNTVKCFPDGTPSAKEIKACRPYLTEELQTVRPKYILALGAKAWQQFGTGPITEHAGREVWKDDLGAWVMPAMHPAYILRFPERKPAWLADIARFGALLDGTLVSGGEPPVEVTVVRSVQDWANLDQAMYDCDAFTYDFETTMLPWWHRDFKAYSVAISTGPGYAFVIPIDHPEATEQERRDAQRFFAEVRPIMEDPKRAKTAHNMLFDDLVWYRVAGYLPYCTADTMVIAQLLDENQPKALKWLGRAKLGWPNWDIDARKEHPLDRLAQYNGYDAAATYLLRQHLLGDLRKAPRLLKYFTRLEMPKLRALERVMVRGVYVDRDALRERAIQARANLEAAAARVPVENPGSTQQLSDWIYNELQLPVIRLTPKGAPSTDKETVIRLALDHPELRDILEYRKWKKNLTTYLLPVAGMIESSIDGRAHHEYRSTSVETGRLASPFHTTPRDSFIRSIYTAQPGWTFIQPDYSQVEARIAAWRALGCPEQASGLPPSSMLAVWMDNQRDVYCETAAEILGKKASEVTRNKEDPNNERQVMGKVPTLAMLYRISPNGLRTYVWREFEIDWSPAQAQAAWQGFYNRWPEFRRWHQREETIIKDRGYVISPIGRIRRLPAAKLPDTGREAWKQIHEAVNAGINAPIQSVASDLTQTAMVLLDRIIREHSLEWIRIVGNVHDALPCEARNDMLDVATKLIHWVMLRAPEALRPLGLALPPGLIDVEIPIGPWGGEYK